MQTGCRGHRRVGEDVPLASRAGGFPRSGAAPEIRLAGEGGFAGKRADVLVTCTGGGGQLYYWQLVRLDGKNAGAKARSDEALKKDLPMPKDIVLTMRYAPLLGALEVQCDVWSLRRAGLDLEKVRLRVEAPGRPGQAALAQEVSHFQKDLAMRSSTCRRTFPSAATLPTPRPSARTATPSPPPSRSSRAWTSKTQP